MKSWKKISKKSSKFNWSVNGTIANVKKPIDMKRYTSIPISS